MKKAVVACLLLAAGLTPVVAGAVYWAWHGKKDSADEGQSASTGADKSPNVSVEVVAPQRRTSIQPGQVEPMERVELIAKIPGYLQSLGKDLDGKVIDTGSRIKGGQDLVSLAVPELEKELKLKKATKQEAESSIQAAREHLKGTEKDQEKYQADLQYRTGELARYEDLYKRNSIEKSLLDEKRSQVEGARAAFQSAEAKVSGMRADLKVAQDRAAMADFDAQRTADLLSYATLRSPANEPKALYVVTHRWADPGAYLQPGSGTQRDAVLSLMRVDQVKVVVEVPEVDTARVALGDRVIFRPAALPNRDFTGKVSRFASALDLQTRTMRVEIDYPNPDGQPLYPGMYGQVILTLGERQGIWMLPSSSVHKEGEKDFHVYTVVGGRAEKVPVTLGADDGVQVEILKGMQPDSQVIRSARGTLKAGQTVAVMEPKKS